MAALWQLPFTGLKESRCIFSTPAEQWVWKIRPSNGWKNIREKKTFLGVPHRPPRINHREWTKALQKLNKNYPCQMYTEQTRREIPKKIRVLCWNLTISKKNLRQETI